MFNLSPTELDARVEARIRRQHVLTREQPLDYCAVIDESVMHRRFGDKSVMRQELDRLAEASRMPNVGLHVPSLSRPHSDWTCGINYMPIAQLHDVPPSVIVHY